MAVIITPPLRAAQRRLYQIADVLAEILSEQAPNSIALKMVANRLEDLSHEFREHADVVAEQEHVTAALLESWATPCR